MPLTKDEKTSVIGQFRINEGDTGSAQVQVALLTQRILQLTDHLKTHAHDMHSKRGLIKLVGQRRRHLRYLSKTNPDAYRDMLKRLNLRR